VFSYVFTVFLLQIYVFLDPFLYVYRNTHVPYILHEMHSFASVFTCFYCRNMYFWYISHVYQNTHVPYILHEMHNLASDFMFFHCVFTANTCTFGAFHMYTKIHRYHIFFMKCTGLLVLLCNFTVFSL
jgi:hypothetical protein